MLSVLADVRFPMPATLAIFRPALNHDPKKICEKGKTKADFLPRNMGRGNPKHPSALVFIKNSLTVQTQFVAWIIEQE